MADLHVDIWRGDSDGRFADYRVPRVRHQTVLDVVTWVQRHLAPDLAYRFACRVGMCGTCAMTVNGKPRWTCRAHVDRVAERDRLVLAPLRGLPVVRDLVVDMAPFFEKWQRADGKFDGARSRREPPAQVNPAAPERQAASAAIECINCAVCYAACDVVAWDADYLGPAALNRAWTLANDERFAGGEHLRQAVTAEGGIYSCHSHGSCGARCPVGLEPTRSIAGLKRWSLAGGVKP